MILIPQIYLKNGKTVKPEGSTSPAFKEDPFETAKFFREMGAEGLLLMDLNPTPLGKNPNFDQIKRIHSELKIAAYVSGGFKTAKEVDELVHAGAEMVILGSTAYQKPDFLEELCKLFPGKIATRLDVRGGHVTIPGYTVSTNKTALDYAEAFANAGVRYIFYSDLSQSGALDDNSIKDLELFCKQARTRIICTSEVLNLGEVEKILTIDAARLEGLVLCKSLYDDRIDFRGAIAVANDISMSKDRDSTLTEF